MYTILFCLQDEVLTISEKVVVRVHDLVTWLSPTLEWSWGREVPYPGSPTSTPGNSPLRHEIPQPQVLTDPGIDFSDVDKQQKEYEINSNSTRKSECYFQTKVVVLSYPRYCRYRALLRRLEGGESSWLCSSIAAALGGFTATPGTRVLFCRDTFDYPDLETHELLCNHLGMYIAMSEVQYFHISAIFPIARSIIVKKFILLYYLAQYKYGCFFLFIIIFIWTNSRK